VAGGSAFRTALLCDAAPLMLLAAIAERTTRLRLGMAVNLMPLHHPLRLAEEIATLPTQFSLNGRVEFGAGRGAFTLKYRGYGVDMTTSRELFEEGSNREGSVGRKSA